MVRHFLEENNFHADEIEEIFATAFEFKHTRNLRPIDVLHGQNWGMLFYKQSTRTRVSFEVGINELGGKALTLDQSNTQIGRGESIEDTAKVLSRFLDGLIIRSHEHTLACKFAEYGSIPVINALTDFLHPCQIYADCMTILEKWKMESNPYHALKNRKIAFYGDTSCNMANSWVLAGALFGLEISLCGPEKFRPQQQIQDFLNSHNLKPTWTFTPNPEEGAVDADVVYTDVWVSMGCEEDSQSRLQAMSPYQVNEATFLHANKDCIFMHCMPAHPGEEVADEVLKSNRAVLFDQAENRLHMQKGILSVLSKLNSK